MDAKIDLDKTIEGAAMLEITARLTVTPFPAHTQTALLLCMLTSMEHLPELERFSAVKTYTAILMDHPEGDEIAAYCMRFIKAAS